LRGDGLFAASRKHAATLSLGDSGEYRVRNALPDNEVAVGHKATSKNSDVIGVYVDEVYVVAIYHVDIVRGSVILHITAQRLVEGRFDG
jgi:hypothetical protein